MSRISDVITPRILRKPVFLPDGRLIGHARTVGDVGNLLRSLGHGKLTLPDLGRYLSEGPDGFYCNSGGEK